MALSPLQSPKKVHKIHNPQKIYYVRRWKFFGGMCSPGTFSQGTGGGGAGGPAGQLNYNLLLKPETAKLQSESAVIRLANR